jgi:tol-pal system protein YbgF
MLRPILLGSVTATLIVAGCATTEDDPVNAKLNDLDARTTRIERVVSNQSLLELSQRVESLQGEVRTLRGRIEELENSDDIVRKQQRALYSDLDKRINQLGGAGVAGAAAGVAAGAAAGAAPAGNAAQEQAAYAQAFGDLKAGKYPMAISEFRQFLTSYPKSDLADNAQYWLGEAYYVSRDFPNAAGAFKAVGDQWPSSRKAPDALLKLGYSQFELKRTAEARATLNDVTKRFPDSDAARLASERLKQMPADGAPPAPASH